MSLSSDLSVMDVRSVSFKNSKKSSPVWLSTDNLLLTMIKNKYDQSYSNSNTSKVVRLTKHGCRSDTGNIYISEKTLKTDDSFILLGSTHGRCGYVYHNTGLRCWVNQTRTFKTGAPTHTLNPEKRNLTDWNCTKKREKTEWK